MIFLKINMKTNREDVPIEDFLKEKVMQDSELHNLDACSLLSPNRFDLGFKLFYLQYKDKLPALASKVYLEHIQAFGDGQYKEYGNDAKNSALAFVSDFNHLIESIEQNGFLSQISFIPLSRTNSTLFNGSHRCACAIHYDRKISTITVDTPSHAYDYLFFKKKLVNPAYLDFAALSILKHNKQISIAIVWGNLYPYKLSVMSDLGDIFYSKNLCLNKQACVNLVSLIYDQEDWVGDPSSASSGAYDKAQRCFSNGPNNVAIILFKTDKHIKDTKELIRQKYSFDKHSLHTSDTHHDSLRLGEMLLNPNIEHYLNNANGHYFSSTIVTLQHISQTLSHDNC